MFSNGISVGILSITTRGVYPTLPEKVPTPRKIGTSLPVEGSFVKRKPATCPSMTSLRVALICRLICEGLISV